MDTHTISQYLSDFGAKRLMLLRCPTDDSCMSLRDLFYSCYPSGLGLVFQERPAYVCQDVKTLATPQTEPVCAYIYNTHISGTNLLRKGVDICWEDLGKTLDKKFSGYVLLAVSKHAKDALRSFLDVLAYENTAGILLVDPESADYKELITPEFLECLVTDTRKRSDAVQVLASFAKCHPKVLEIIYPGVKESPDFSFAAANYNGGFGFCFGLRLRDAACIVDADEYLSEHMQIEIDTEEKVLFVTALSHNAMAQVMELEGYLAQLTSANV